MEYTFTLKYRLPESGTTPDVVLDRLCAEGCDDALVGIGRPGRIALEFTRDAQSAKEALRSALADVRRAIPDARLIEAAPDFVGLSDVAEIAGVSRQNMRKLLLTHTASFPAPVHEGPATIWHLADILAWLEAKGGYVLPAAIREIAQVALDLNLARESRRLTSSKAEDWKGLLV